MLAWKYVEYIGNKLSMIIYFIHVIVGHYLEYFIKLLDINSSIIYDLFPILVVFFSILFAYFIKKFLDYIIIQKCQPINLVMGILIFISLFSFIVSFLPTGKRWQMLAEVNENTSSVIVDDLKHFNEIVTVQSENGESIGSMLVPMQQFMGGGTVLVYEDKEFVVKNITNTMIDIFVPQNHYGYIRIWAR